MCENKQNKSVIGEPPQGLGQKKGVQYAMSRQKRSVYLNDGYQPFVGEPVISEIQLPHEW